MALGTITVNKVVREGPGSLMLADISIVGDSNVPAGGTLGVQATLRAAIAAQDGLVGSLSNLDLLGVVKIDANLDDDVHYVAATDALQVRDASDGSEKTGNQSGVTYRVLTYWA